MKQSQRETKAVSFHPRKLARSVAKANMKRAGIQKINSSFSLNWRKWVTR